MATETRIRFLDGEIVITQSSTGDHEQQQSASAAESKVQAESEDELDLGTHFEPAPDSGAPETTRFSTRLRGGSLGSGEFPTTATGGGGPFGCGLTLVFGSLIVNARAGGLGSGEFPSTKVGGQGADQKADQKQYPPPAATD
jgi:hypothetical protein